MNFVGLDLAWVEGNQTGIAVLDADGHLLCVSGAISNDSICEAIEPHVSEDCLVAIDAPLIVTNPAGQRPAELLLNRHFAPFQAGAHPANTGNPMFVPPRGAVPSSVTRSPPPHVHFNSTPVKISSTPFFALTLLSLHSDVPKTS